MMKSQFAIVALSSATYGTLLTLLKGTSSSTTNLRVLIKSISAVHSFGTTVLALIALMQPWELSHGPVATSKIRLTSPYFDDTNNPIIAGKQRLANVITAWEAGYLIYDTSALLLEVYNKDGIPDLVSAFQGLLKDSPIFVTHHVALIAALLYLQTYIEAEREKGLWIIMAFICMNASTPLLHLRWWHKKRTGRSNKHIDRVLVLVFALARFGTVYWVMKKYGQFHEMGPWEAFSAQRWQCKAGTSVLTGTNFVWWLLLLSQMRRSTLNAASL